MSNYGWWWALLIVLCAVGCVLLGYRISEKHWLRAPGQIVPAAAILPADPRLLRERKQRQRLGAAIRVLLRRVDSLAADSAGRKMYDSLVTARPGLLDSAKIAARYFSMEEILNQ